MLGLDRASPPLSLPSQPRPSPTSTPPPPLAPSSLPRGDCRFILLLPDVTGQRCACQGFRRNEALPGSSCECGHQACYHVPESRGEGVSRQEYDALLDRVASLEGGQLHTRWTDDDFRNRATALEGLVEQGQSRLSQDVRAACRAIQGLHASLSRLQLVASSRFVAHEDKIDGLIDRATALEDELRSVRGRVVAIDDLTMMLEDRLTEMSSPDGGDQPFASIEERLKAGGAPSIRNSFAAENDIISPSSWTAQVVLVPTPFPKHIFSEQSKAHRRCTSRGLSREVTFVDRSGHTFQMTIETVFHEALKNRPWTPLAYRPSSCSVPMSALGLEPLSEHLRQSASWGFDFLQEHQVLVGQPQKGSVRTLYITITDGAGFPWNEIRNLPKAHDSDDDCWEHDEALDGTIFTNEEMPETKSHGHRDQDISPKALVAISGRKRRSYSTSSITGLPTAKKRNILGVMDSVSGVNSFGSTVAIDFIAAHHTDEDVPQQRTPTRMQRPSTTRQACHYELYSSSTMAVV